MSTRVHVYAENFDVPGSVQQCNQEHVGQADGGYLDMLHEKSVQLRPVLSDKSHEVAQVTSAVTSSYMVSPNTPWRMKWEVVIHVLIVYQVCVIPFELAFLEDALMHTSAFFLLAEVFFILIFFADIVLNFRTGIEIPGRNEIIMDYRIVARAYLRGWFCLDFVAWLPAIVAVALPSGQDNEIEDGRSTQLARLGRSLKSLRIVRMLRLVQLVRIVKLSRAAQNIQLQLSESAVAVKLVHGAQLALLVIFTMHLAACVWAGVALDDHLDSASILTNDASIASRYMLALWWASCSLSFGGQPEPRSDSERLLTFFMNLLNVFLLGIIFAWCGVFYSSVGEEKREMMRAMRAASRFAEYHGLSRYSNYKELREAMHLAIRYNQRRQHIDTEFKEMVESGLSDNLRREIYGRVYEETLKWFPPFSPKAPILFRHCEIGAPVPEVFLWHLAGSARVRAFQAKEHVVTQGELATTMGFVTEGSLVIIGTELPRSQVLLKKMWFGEKVLIYEDLRHNAHGNTFFSSRAPVRSSTIVAREPSTVLEIGHDDFKDAVREFGLQKPWLDKLIKHVRMKQGTLGCSWCQEISHHVFECPDPKASEGSIVVTQREIRRASNEKETRRGNCRPKWLPDTGPGNRSVPPDKWGMTLKQWAAFITCCCFTDVWDELERSSERKVPGYVNLYQINNHMVKPWTRNTGNSVALLLNSDAPLGAAVMISHAWGESILETLVAVLGQARTRGMTLCTPVWFCTFSQYQASEEDDIDIGPTIAEQLKMDPFGTVIMSNPYFGMLVVHTSSSEVYARLWCVYEVFTAQDSGLDTFPAYSMGALQKLFKDNDWDRLVKTLTVDTSQALCATASDTERIRKEVKNAGGFDKLNEHIKDFRLRSVKRFGDMFESFAQWASGGDDKEEVLEKMTQLVAKAGFLVGLQCLSTYNTSGKEQIDEQVMADMHMETNKILELWEKAFKGFKTLPPGLDLKDLPATWIDANQCFADAKVFPFALRLLEISAGGSPQDGQEMRPWELIGGT